MSAADTGPAFGALAQEAAAPLHRVTRGTGPDLVLVHGWALNSALWCTVAPRLAARWRVTCIDLPGHGRSPPASEPTLEAWAQAVAAAAPRGAAWIGWSLGAMVVLAAAARGVVSRAVLVGATPRFVRARDWAAGVEEGVLEGFAEELARRPERTVTRFLHLASDPGRRDQVRVLRSALTWPGSAGPAGLEAGLGILRTADLRGLLGRVAAPVCLIHGDRDRLVPAAAALTMARLLPRARLELIPGAGHAPFLSHPERFVELVERFFADAALVGSGPSGQGNRHGTDCTR